MKTGFISAMAALMMGGLALPAQAQLSNSLGAATERQMPDIDALEATYDPVFFEPAVVAYILEQGGLAIVENQAYPATNAHLIVATASGLPFIFAFVECEGAKCGIMKQIHVSPTTLAGLSFTPQTINDLNTLYTLGAFFVEEGNLGFRYSLAAAPDCTDACLLGQMKIFMVAIDDIYGMLSQMMNQSTVSLEPEALAADGIHPLADLVAGQPDIAAVGAVPFDISSFAGIASAGGLDTGALDLSELLEMAGIDLSEGSDWDGLLGD